MRQEGERRIAAPREAVWRALNDPEVLARSIGGCQSLERTADDAFHARVRSRVGPLAADFTADITLTDIDPPRAYVLNANVKGGAAGFAKGVAKVALADDGEGTLLTYAVEGNVGGKLAQIGQRLIDAAARKQADDFFAAFETAIARPAAVAVPPPRRRPMIRWLIALATAALAVVVARLLTR
jgi:hypothetical protein